MRRANANGEGGLATVSDRPAQAAEGLSVEELHRYSRHLLLPQVGMAGQRKLKDSRVLVIGAGGLGSPLALYLAAAGVGTLGLVDFDTVDASNLQRQLLYGTKDVGRSKLAAAVERIRDTNPHVQTHCHEERLTSANALSIMRGYHVIVDGTDNFATRYLTNDACVLLGLPNVYGSIYRFDGQVSVFANPTGPCYRCVFPHPPPPDLVPSCADGGVLGVLPGIVGTLQALETLKILLGIGDPLVGKLLLVDALAGSFRTMQLFRDPACPACGTRELRTLIDYDQFCNPTATHVGVPEMSPVELAAKRVRGDDFDLIDVREPHELRIASLDHSRPIPLGALAEALSTLDASREIVVFCRSGVRSQRAVRQLMAAGFQRVWNLSGGILRWSDDVDPSVSKY
jgi:molybdopterin/thiamine biosynthesis adenylyltransferase/rhodanese-related sulfurtransferase